MQYEIGLYKNKAGDPMITVDGKILTTVDQMKGFIERYEDSLPKDKIYLDDIVDEINECVAKQVERASATTVWLNEARARIDRLISDNDNFERRVIETIRTAKKTRQL